MFSVQSYFCHFKSFSLLSMYRKNLLGLLSLGATMFAWQSSVAQSNNDLSKLFRVGFSDLETVATGYVKPVGVGFAAGMGGNWYNTANTHDVLGFEINLNAGALFVPDKDKTFSLLGLKKLQTVDPTKTTAPSFSGSGSGTDVAIYQNDTTIAGKFIPKTAIAKFTTPDGVAGIIPALCVQGTIGLPKGTDLTIRFLPKAEIGGVNGSLWGVGVKHNIKQWIPGLDEVPFSLSVMLGYTKFNLDYSFESKDRVYPWTLVNDTSKIGLSYPSGSDYAGQGFKINTSSLMANVIVSKTLLFFTPFLGLGFNQNNFKFNFKGDFPVLTDAVISGSTTKPLTYKVENLKDPIQLDYKTFMPNATLGFKLKFGIVGLHAQYTFQEYPYASGGLNFGFR